MSIDIDICRTREEEAECKRVASEYYRSGQTGVANAYMRKARMLDGVATKLERLAAGEA